jgi:hypothetical protein
MNIPGDLGAFLSWFGGSAAIGAVISWLMANWAWFQTRSSGQKTAILYGLAVGMGIVSRLAVTYIPAGVVTDLQPYYSILLTSAVIVGGQQIWYAKVEKPKQEATTVATPLGDLSISLTPTVTDEKASANG